MQWKRGRYERHLRYFIIQRGNCFSIIKSLLSILLYLFCTRLLDTIIHVVGTFHRCVSTKGLNGHYLVPCLFIHNIWFPESHSYLLQPNCNIALISCFISLWIYAILDNQLLKLKFSCKVLPFYFRIVMKYK